MNKLLISILLVLLLNLYLFIINKTENFINVFDAHQVYQNYRNYIDTNYGGKIKHITKLQQICKLNRPSMISSNCYYDTYNKCLNNSQLSKKSCIINASNRCVIAHIN